MLLEAVYHRPGQNWCYAYDEKTIHLRLRTKKNDVLNVQALTVDKYAFETTKTMHTMIKFTSDAWYDYWETAVEPPFRRLQYAFQIRDGRHSYWLTERGISGHPPSSPIGLFEYPYLHESDILRPPEWVKDAVFYQIFPERFANGDPANDPESVRPWGDPPTQESFFGGDLQGVMDKLDYLQELGVDAIYFNPLFEAATNHKYDTSDYLKVDRHFGSNELLKELVAACHERNIRVLLDAVFNHCGRYFAPFVDVCERGSKSPYADWFHIKEFPPRVRDGLPSYETFAFEPIMPKLNTAHPEVKSYLLEVARYWSGEVGIDGWRLDVANEVDHRFWREFHDTVKALNPDAYILGEVWHDAMPWLEGDQFDAAMNYPFTNAVIDFFVREQTDAAQLGADIGKLLASYPRQAHEAAFNLLGSHDTPRILQQCGGDKRKMKLAALFQFTYPGTPCIYYGDEIGLKGAGTGDQDPDCRECMQWDETKQDRELLSFYKELIRLRRSHPALRRGSMRFLQAEKGQRTIAYERKNDHEHIVVVINADAKEAALTAPLSEGTWEHVFAGTRFEAQGVNTVLPLEPYGYAVFKKR